MGLEVGPVTIRFLMAVRADLHPTTLLQAIAAVEAQLGEPLRDDGPILGVEFDQLPPGAFGSPIGICFPSSMFFNI